MDDAELDDLRREFKVLDDDKNGYIDRKEARARILAYVKRRQKAKNAMWTNDQVETMVEEKTKRYMEKYDNNTDGYIVFTEYVKLAHDLEVQIYRRVEAADIITFSQAELN